MSNTRRLKPPPRKWSYRRFAQAVLDSDLDEDTKRQLLVRAAYADKKGRIPGEPGRVDKG